MSATPAPPLVYDPEWAEVDTVFDEFAKGLASVPGLGFSSISDAGEKREGAVVALVYPLVVDVAERRAWFTVAVGLVFSAGDPRQFTPEELAQMWTTLTTPGAGEPPRSETSSRSAPRAGPPQARVLQDSCFWSDALAAKAIGFFGDFNLPRNWDSVKTWPTLVENEVTRLRNALGETAFHHLPGKRTRLLRRTFTASGVELVELSKEAKKALEETAGRVGFRLVKEDPDRIKREYFVKRVPTGRGALTMSLTWYGQAFPLSPEVLAKEEERLRAAQDRDAGDLFPASEDERRKRDLKLGLLGSMKDAARIAPRLLALLYQQGANPIHINAWELGIALGCEKDKNRLSRVSAALETLRRLEYEYQGEGLGPDLSGRVRGSFATEIRQSAHQGPGGHGEVDFHITLSRWVVGCLRVFELPESQLKDPHRVFFNWTAKLEKTERKALNYVKGFSGLSSYFDDAAGLTPPQKRLRIWIEDQLTRRFDATAKGHKTDRLNRSAPDASEPRVYTSDFCPRLEKGKGYHGALGHFPKNAETGRTLQGRSRRETATGGPRAGGLLEVLGRELPPGRAIQARVAMAGAALKDLRAVVEECLEGLVVGRHRGVWLTLGEAQHLPAEEVLKDVSWFLFIPEDWLDRRRETFESHQRLRFNQGLTDQIVRVTTTSATADKVGLDGTELRIRLRAARRERKLTSDAVGKLFGVSRMTVSNWERGRDAGGARISEDRQPLIFRWIEQGEGPSEDELKALAARRRGGKKRAVR